MHGMWLPAPTPEGVELFRAMVRDEVQLELDERAALELATRVLQIQVAKLYEERRLRQKVK